MLNRRRILLSTIILTILISCLFTLNAIAKSETEQGVLEIDGSRTTIDYKEIDKNLYLPIVDISKELKMNLTWDGNNKSINLQYEDGSTATIYLNSKKLSRESLRTSIDTLLYKGVTYINIEDLEDIIDYNYYWDEHNKTLYTYLYAYPIQGKSIINYNNNNLYDLYAFDNTINFDVERLSKAEWEMNGELTDFRLISKSINMETTEYKYAAFYTTADNKVSQIVFTQRVLPNKDQMLLITGYSATDEQVFIQNVSNETNVYGSDFYIYKDKDPYHELITEKKHLDNSKIELSNNQSIDCWSIYSEEELEITDSYIKRAWESSKSASDSNEWINARGTNTDTPKAYKNNYIFQDNNFNLQSSTPSLLLEAYQVVENRLLEDIVHNAAYTLIQNQDKDGFWHSGISVSYLNKSYQLGPEFIDTRMSVDASLFLLRYGQMFDNEKAIKCGMNFKNYFYMLKDEGLSYKKGNGTVYPDYYSANYNGKTLVSLNHALYEMQYLYTIYNWFGDEDSKELADEMLSYIENTVDNWVSPKGDLYYAYSTKSKYYANDYINVTYVDLFALQSILNYQNRGSDAIDYLYEQKGKYLDQKDSAYYESKINLEYIYNNFDGKLKNKGDLFVSYPVDIVKAEDKDFAYASYGGYVFVKGVESVTYNNKTLELEPENKYLLILTKDKVNKVEVGDGLFYPQNM